MFWQKYLFRKIVDFYHFIVRFTIDRRNFHAVK